MEECDRCDYRIIIRAARNIFSAECLDGVAVRFASARDGDFDPAHWYEAFVGQ